MLRPNTVVGILAIGLLCVVGAGAQGPTANVADEWYAAIRSNDSAAIDRLIAAGADVNVHDRRGGATPLMHAAAIGSIDTVRRLLDRGADVNARSAAGATALMWAVTDFAKVRLLVDRGADVKAASESGRTALHLAAMSAPSASIVRLLLERGADAKAIDRESLTTIVAATLGNDTDTIRLLVDAGADVNLAHGGDTPESSGQTPLMNAAANGNDQAVRLLLAKGANVNAVSNPPAVQVKNGTIALGRFTALILAAPQASPSTVRQLLDAGADINAREARGMTALAYAAASDHSNIDTVKLLIERGARLDVATPEKETALDWALKGGETPVAALLLKAGAKPTPVSARTVPAPSPVAAHAAVERGISSLERMSGTFFVNGACGACHAQSATDIAVAAARSHGIKVDEAGIAQRRAGIAGQFGGTATRLLERFDGPVVDILLYMTAGLVAANHPADRATDALVFNIAAQQSPSGAWHVGGIVRPPIEDGDFSRTALAIKALTVYGMPGRRDEMQHRIANATSWLKGAAPLTTEDHAFRLLGMIWGKADAASVDAAARALGEMERADGGWAQRREMNSDAYATGLALYALLESHRATDAALDRGRAYLLSTQRADGTWHVRSRAPKFQPYFDGGFPYEHDQWISSMATAWSTAALAGTLDRPTRVADLR